LAKRKRLAAEASARQQQQEQEQEQQQQQQERATRSSLLGGSQLLQAADPASGQGDAQRVLHGKLFEIDLGDEARARNIEMTERARRRLQGLADDEMQNDGSGSGSGSGSAGTGGGLSKKPRLGKGPRNRRGSDDIQRDQMVEAFLSENKRMFTSFSLINFHFQTDLAFQSTCMTSLPKTRTWALIQATRTKGLPTTGSPRNSGASSWKRWRNGTAAGGRRRTRRNRAPRAAPPPTSRSYVARSLAAVGMQGPQCATYCSRSRLRSRRRSRWGGGEGLDMDMEYGLVGVSLFVGRNDHWIDNPGSCRMGLCLVL